MSTDYVPGTGRGAGDTAASKIDKTPCPHGADLAGEGGNKEQHD